MGGGLLSDLIIVHYWHESAYFFWPLCSKCSTPLPYFSITFLCSVSVELGRPTCVTIFNETCTSTPPTATVMLPPEHWINGSLHALRCAGDEGRRINGASPLRLSENGGAVKAATSADTADLVQ